MAGIRYRAAASKSLNAVNGGKANGGKQNMNKPQAKATAIKLAISLVVFLSVYFGFIKAGFQIIQEIYIWSAFAIAICYVFAAYFIAYIKNSGKYENNKKAQSALTRLDSIRRLLLILLIPQLLSLLADYMLIKLELAGFFGI